MPTNPATRSHYDVLGVSSTADLADIRRAYHRAARQWHPDRLAAVSAADAATGEVEMRRVNEAWEVLRDPERRRDYDRVLGDRGRPGGSAGGGRERSVRIDGDGVIRIDPRLLDPDFVAARRQAQADAISNRTSLVIRAAPLVGFLGILAAIFVFTAYARGGADGVPTTTLPGPNLGTGITAGTCVSVIGGPSLLARPCDANADGVVIGARLPDGVCPATTIREVELTNGAIACLGRIP